MMRLVLYVRKEEEVVRRYHLDYDETEGEEIYLTIGEYLIRLDNRGNILEQAKIKKS